MVQPINTALDPQGVQRKGNVASEDKKEKKVADSNVLFAVWHLLLQATQTTTETGVLQAKGLELNAASQERENAQLQQLNLLSVPKKDFKRKRVTIGEKKVDPLTHKGHTKEKVRRWRTILTNQLIVLEAQTKNEKITNQRQDVQNVLGSLQQEGSVKQTTLSSSSDQMEQNVQQSVGVLDLIKNMTFSANLTKPPQA